MRSTLNYIVRKPLIHTHCHLICCVYIKGHVSIHIVWCWRSWDTWIQDMKAMSKVSKILYRFQDFTCYVCWRHQRWCLWLLCNTAYRILLLILLMLKVSNMSNTLYCTLYTGPFTPPGGKTCTAFCLVDLAVHHHSVKGGSFVKFLGLVKLQGWLQARCTANPQFLKLRGCSATQ